MRYLFVIWWSIVILGTILGFVFENIFVAVLFAIIAQIYAIYVYVKDKEND